MTHSNHRRGTRESLVGDWVIFTSGGGGTVETSSKLFEIYSNPQELNIILPLLFLCIYYVYESIIFVKNKERSVPSVNDDVPAFKETNQPNRLEKRKGRLDSLFEYALVLLGILAAAEFQYFLTTVEKGIFPYAMRVFTVPFVVLILF